MADHSDSEEIAARMKSVTRKLHDLASLVGAARQVREFSSDQRKVALSVEVAKFLDAGESVSAAEHKARASGDYRRALAVLSKQYEAAESTIATWLAENCSFEAARSLLSFQKSTIERL